jgi:hypothetical protein
MASLSSETDSRALMHVTQPTAADPKRFSAAIMPMPDFRDLSFLVIKEKDSHTLHAMSRSATLFRRRFKKSLVAHENWKRSWKSRSMRTGGDFR